MHPMCGRYRLSQRKEILAEHFDTDSDDLDWEPRYNIAPTQPVAVVRRAERGSARRVSMMRWGLVPSWAADPSIGTRTINARAETAATKPSFREPLRKQRCLVPADAFYEWRRLAKEKQPVCFEVGAGTVFAFAGLWDSSQGPGGLVRETWTILTTTPNDLLADVHDRMPVILHVDHYDRWLDPGMLDAEAVMALLRPHDASLMRRYPVSKRVNIVLNDDPECSAPVELPATTGSLFG